MHIKWVFNVSFNGEWNIIMRAPVDPVFSIADRSSIHRPQNVEIFIPCKQTGRTSWCCITTHGSDNGDDSMCMKMDTKYMQGLRFLVLLCSCNIPKMGELALDKLLHALVGSRV